MDESDDKSKQQELYDLRVALLNPGRSRFIENSPGKSPFCSFCGHGHGEYETLIEGPRVFICNTCVDASQALVNERPDGTKEAPDN